jgi:hypothetical protein
MAEWLGGLLSHLPMWLVDVAIIIIFAASIYVNYWIHGPWPGGLYYEQRRRKNGKK